MHGAGQGCGVLSASLLGSYLPPPRDGGTRAHTPAKHALLKPRWLAAPQLTEQTHGRGKCSCRCPRAAQHQTTHGSRGEGGEHPACPRPSALKCIFSLTCNTVLLSQTMSVFNQFLYPRHCRAERPRRPDGSCCRSLPALPRPPPNSLQIPGMPAPPKTSPRQGRGRHRSQEQGLGVLPRPPLLATSSSCRAGPRQRAAAPGCCLLRRVTCEWFTPEMGNLQAPFSFTHGRGVSYALEGCADPKTPHPSPKGIASTGAAGGKEERLPIIPTTFPRPPGPRRTTHSSSFHPRLPALIPAPAAGHGSSPSPSQNPGTDPSLGKIKGEAPADFKQPACPLVPAIQMGEQRHAPQQSVPCLNRACRQHPSSPSKPTEEGKVAAAARGQHSTRPRTARGERENTQLAPGQARQLGWWVQTTPKHVLAVQQGSCSSGHSPSTLASTFLREGGGYSCREGATSPGKKPC